MVYTTEGFTDNSTMSSGPYLPVKEPNVMKSLRKFSETLGVKPKTGVLQLCADKAKRKAIITGSMLWYSI